jgi:hypothetical protein
VVLVVELAVVVLVVLETVGEVVEVEAVVAETELVCC